MIISRTFILYILIGGLCFLIETLSFIAIRHHLNLILSNVLSIYIASLVSFFLNSFYNFSIKDDKFLRYIKFIIVIQIGTVFSSFLLYYLVSYLDEVVAKIFTIPFIVVIQYVLNKSWTFKSKKKINGSI
mgnify:CR=1 FL=1